MIPPSRTALPHAPTSASTPDESAAGPGSAVKSETLFRGAPELLIDHRGVVYRLRQTSLGKLILTK